MTQEELINIRKRLRLCADALRSIAAEIAQEGGEDEWIPRGNTRYDLLTAANLAEKSLRRIGVKKKEEPYGG